jgi:hypothetical protein
MPPNPNSNALRSRPILRIDDIISCTLLYVHTYVHCVPSAEKVLKMNMLYLKKHPELSIDYLTISVLFRSQLILHRIILFF